VASLEGLGADDLGAMMSGDCVNDCQHDKVISRTPVIERRLFNPNLNYCIHHKVGVSFGGDSMTLARWPNLPEDITSPAAWANTGECQAGGGFIMDLKQHPEAERILQWKQERDPWVHGFWAWDWADCYGKVLDVSQEDHTLRLAYADTVPACKSGARFMGVNLLCELDAPDEYYIDPVEQELYLIPPTGKSLKTSVVNLMYQPGGVVNISSTVKNASLVNIDVRDGRHVGILAEGAENAKLDGVVVHAHGTHGVDLTNAPGSSVTASQIFDVGCTGLRITAGQALTLRPGNLLVTQNAVHHYAKWKRSYQPGIFWGGVGNVFRGNKVYFGPHNGFLGGGDFADGVNNLFEGNIITDCTFDTIDSGAFYTCGQRGAAFTNRGNVLRGNRFERIHNTAGTGVQVASNQAVYMTTNATPTPILSLIESGGIPR